MEYTLIDNIITLAIGIGIGIGIILLVLAIIGIRESK